MKVLWCWRCGMDVPMLDEAEFKRVAAPYFEPLRTPRARHCAACGAQR